MTNPKTLLCLVSLLLLLACKNNSTNNEQPQVNAAKESEKPKANKEKPKEQSHTLESLLQYNSHTALKAAFGENVIKSQGYLPEGEGTYENSILFPKTNKEVEFVWKDEANYKDLLTLRLYHKDAAWKTKEGVGIGTSMVDVEQANEKPFLFYGMEWDYCGYVSNWQGGKLDEAEDILGARFGLPNDSPDVQLDYNQVVGDGEFVSNNALVKKIPFVVVELSLSPGRLGKLMHEKGNLKIFENAAYYHGEEIYHAGKKLEKLIIEEETYECPVDYTYKYSPLSASEVIFSYSLQELGSYACGPPASQTSINTINLEVGELYEVQDFFTEESLVAALKADTWVNNNFLNIDSLSSSQELLNAIGFEAGSFYIIDYTPNKAKVRLVGFEQIGFGNTDAIELGLELKPLYPINDFAFIQELKK